jgi:peptide/nickel transport system ATP-binding protein
MADPLLEVSDLVISYRTLNGTVRALEKISLSVAKGESIALVGESGSGKSTLGLSIVKLLPQNSEYTSGEILLDGKAVTKFSNAQMKEVRGTVVFMIFQDPLNSLNPVKRIGNQILEALTLKYKREGHDLPLDNVEAQLIEALNNVRIPDPKAILERYPHQLSGGQIQRVIIAMGLLMMPKLMIADEPTSAIDVTLQAQILKLLNELKTKYNMSLIFITHDIGVANIVADRIGVMYAGKLVEIGPTDEVIYSPSHPYSRGLIASLPSGNRKKGRLQSILGAPASLLTPPSGCRYHPRCPYVMEICKRSEPGFVSVKNTSVACWLYSNQSAESQTESGLLTSGISVPAKKMETV